MGIPCEMSGDVLKEKVLKIFGKLVCEISPDFIEVCNCVGRATGKVIIEFSKRKHCQHVWIIKNDLKKVSMEDLEFSWE